MSMPKLNAPAEIHWRRSNMNTRDPILMKSVEVLKDCRSLNAAAEINCPMSRSVEKVPIRNEKRCSVVKARPAAYPRLQGYWGNQARIGGLLEVGMQGTPTKN